MTAPIDTSATGTDGAAPAPGGLRDRLLPFVGRPLAPPFRAPDPVNAPMIRHFCDAIEDHGAAYTDPASAAATIHEGIVAPPAMLQVWTMRGLRPISPPPEEDVSGKVFDILDRAGFTSIVATNCEQEYVRYLRPGDHLTRTSVLQAVSDEKKTGLGTGHFLEWRDDFHTDDGELVGTMLFRVLKFRPRALPGAPEAPAPDAQPRRPRPSINEDNAFFWDGVNRGELLIQRCAACGVLRHPPRPMCGRCRSLDWDTVTASGRGTVHSYVIPYHPPLPMFPQPYVVALIDLEEGTRLVSNVIDVAPKDVTVGMAVELAITPVDDELTLPLFRPAGTENT